MTRPGHVFAETRAILALRGTQSMKNIRTVRAPKGPWLASRTKNHRVSTHSGHDHKNSVSSAIRSLSCRGATRTQLRDHHRSCFAAVSCYNRADHRAQARPFRGSTALIKVVALRTSVRRATMTIGLGNTELRAPRPEQRSVSVGALAHVDRHRDADSFQHNCLRVTARDLPAQ